MEYGSMGKIENGYKLIKGFLNKEEVNLLQKYTELYHRFNTSSFDNSGQSETFDTCVYTDPIMDCLLLSKQKRVEEEINLKLFPTYTFWRMYTYGADLKKHTDRNSCEISVTVCLWSDGTDWPIFINGNSVLLKPGDGVIYEGIRVPHWRDEFKGDGQSQVFLHYVDADGEHKDHKYDKKTAIGYPR
jgi:hypothetical protein